MAKYGSKDVAYILIDGVDVKGDTTEISDISIETILEETHTLGDSWHESTPVGLRKVMFDQDGFFNDAATSLHSKICDLQETSRVVSIGLSSTRFIGIQGAFGAKYSRKVDRGKLHKVKVKYTVSGQVNEAKAMAVPSTVRTVDWTSTSEDNTAASTNGGAGYMQVTSFAGFTGFIGSIEKSTDNVSWTTLLTFTNVTSAPNAQRVTVTGTVPRYLRFNGNVTGTGTITVSAGFSRG